MSGAFCDRSVQYEFRNSQLNSMESLEARSFHINPAGYIPELGTSVGTAAFAGLNFVQIRHCKGGRSP